MIIIKTQDDISKIKIAASIWKKTRAAIVAATKPGVSLKALDQLAKETIEANGGQAAFYNYLGFAGNICISVNECVIHGVPTDYVLKHNDKVTFDVGVKYQEHYCDAAFTLVLGDNVQAHAISKVCYEAMMIAINLIKPGTSTHTISGAIQKYVQQKGYHVIRDFTGHGCGVQIHEDPLIPNYRSLLFPNVKLVENMVICIEPMILTGSNEYFIDPKDRWSVIAKNRLMTCHWEHMVLVTKDGFEILTE